MPGQEVRVELPQGLWVEEALDRLAQATGRGVIAYLPEESPEAIEAIPAPLPLEQVLDHLAAQIGNGWIVSGKRLVFVRLAAPEARARRAWAFARFWTSLEASLREALIQGRVVPLNQLSDFQRRALQDLSLYPPEGINQDTMIGWSISYDLDFLGTRGTCRRGGGYRPTARRGSGSQVGAGVAGRTHADWPGQYHSRPVSVETVPGPGGGSGSSSMDTPGRGQGEATNRSCALGPY